MDGARTLARKTSSCDDRCLSPRMATKPWMTWMPGTAEGREKSCRGRGGVRPWLVVAARRAHLQQRGALAVLEGEGGRRERWPPKIQQAGAGARRKASISGRKAVTKQHRGRGLTHATASRAPAGVARPERISQEPAQRSGPGVKGSGRGGRRTVSREPCRKLVMLAGYTAPRSRLSRIACDSSAAMREAAFGSGFGASPGDFGAEGPSSRFWLPPAGRRSKSRDTVKTTARSCNTGRPRRSWAPSCPCIPARQWTALLAV